MERRNFLKLSSILGVSLPIPWFLKGCGLGNSHKEVLIIGAGAAGMSAGYLLHQMGVDFQIIEASATHGGRLKTTTSFADFPIPLGAEWLHIEEGIFAEIVNDSTIPVNVDMVSYGYNDPIAIWDGARLTTDVMGENPDQKFINSTWLGFYNTYILPSISSKITYDTLVTSVDYAGEDVVVNTEKGQTYTADNVIVTIPLGVLQSGDVRFTPALPARKTRAINNTYFWPGMKVFMQFSQKFYPTFITVETDESGEISYFDAAYGQNTRQNILGFFTIGDAAAPYFEFTGDALRDYLLAELDRMYDNKATKYFVKYVEQNWVNEPYMKGAYLDDDASRADVRALAKTVDDRLYFAGEAYTDGRDWGGAHTAARAAKRVVDEILG